MPRARDPFSVLGVPAGADEETIKHAFRALALRHHPDRSDAPDAGARFRELLEAYELLAPAAPRREPRPDSSAIVAFYAWLAGRHAAPPAHPDPDPEPAPPDPPPLRDGELSARLAAVVGLAYALALLALVLAR